MSIRDYFKNSVWESFMSGQGLTADFVMTAGIAMVLAVILGVCIYMIYGHDFGGNDGIKLYADPGDQQ